MQAKLNVLIVAKDLVHRQGLRVLVSSVGAYNSKCCSELPEDFTSIAVQPDVILVMLDKDVKHPTHSITPYLKHDPNVPIIVYCPDMEVELEYKLVQKGVKVVLSKSLTEDLLLAALTAVKTGSVLYSQQILDRISKRYPEFISNKINKQAFSPIKQRVLQLLAYGHRSEEIADFLHLSKRTVDRHREDLLNAFNVKNTVQLVQLAVALRLIDSPYQIIQQSKDVFDSLISQYPHHPN